MRAFWWFRDNAIAGMARPGFNAIHWSDLPIDEGILIGWLGQFSSEAASLDSFRRHLKSYAPKVFPFFKMTYEQGEKAMKVFEDEQKMLDLLGRLAKRTGSFSNFFVKDDALHIQLNESRIKHELDHLKTVGINRLVSLTEKQHNKNILSEHFDLHHIGIDDLHAPSHNQVEDLARIIADARDRREVVAVHCLAGIGRTSTMLMAAHILLGESFDELKEQLAERNPTYVLAGKQGEFISSFLQGKESRQKN